MWKNRVFVIGVGMTKFEKPGRRKDFDYPDMAKESGTKALKDAGISFKDVEHASVGYCYGDSTCGQRAVYQLGMTGIPIYNVNNNCSTGSTALLIAKQLIEGGLANCVMALGFEKMQSGSLVLENMNRTIPMDKHLQHMADTRGLTESPVAAQMFGNAGREHMERYGTKPEHFAKIAVKNHKHSVNNPYSQFQDEYTLEDVLKSRTIHEPLTKLQCCPTSDGSAAAILAIEEFRPKYLYNKSKAGEFIDRGDNTYGGKFVVNPSGGLISKGHPLGATGLAQCSELCWQLRNQADKRQVSGVKAALQHNIGLGGAVVVTAYKLGFPEMKQELQPKMSSKL
uniref:propanoyl-CoA C-acyltransferase n=1 Tax=Saccoglossus kowalevskii TaxID=10224 RepID=A0ABM0GQ32_SACKO|nr:PREDICTED: non-specific lipid-transfer protein-like [Saccoglossus kowalevskii]